MKQMGALKNFAALVTLVSLSVLGSIGLGAKPSMAAHQFGNRFETEFASPNNYRSDYEVASARAVCRRVSTNGGRLFVRNRPNGRIIGYAYDGTPVRVVLGSSYGGWVRLATGGYVYSRYLTRC